MRTDVDLPRIGPNGRLCQPCAARTNKKVCARCGRTARIIAPRAEGGICNFCYRIDPEVPGMRRLRADTPRRHETPGGKAICGAAGPGPAPVKDLQPEQARFRRRTRRRDMRTLLLSRTLGRSPTVSAARLLERGYVQVQRPHVTPASAGRRLQFCSGKFRFGRYGRRR